MAFPATNMRVKTGPTGFLTKGSYFYPALETGSQWATHLSAQLHEFAGIRPVDGRNRAGSAQVTGPG